MSYRALRGKYFNRDLWGGRLCVTRLTRSSRWESGPGKG